MLKRPQLLIAIGVLALCLVPGHVRADAESDNRALLNRVIELESQVRDLSQKTAAGSGASGLSSAGAVSGNVNAPDVETRLSSLESQIRNLTGQVEQSAYQTQQTNAALQKMNSDLDMRFQALEQRPMTGAPVAAVAAPMPDPNAAAVAPPLAGGATDSVIGSIAAGQAATGPEDLYNQAYSEMQRKEYGTAQQDFKKFLTDNPNSKLAPNAQYWLGEIYYAQGNYKMASATFADGYQKAPKGAKAPDNLLKLGLSLEQQNRNKDACTVLRQLVKDYPNAPDTLTSSASRGIKRLQCTGNGAA